MVAVSGGLNPAFGNMVKAVAGRKQQPGSWLLVCARWFAEPARQTVWHRLVKNAELTPARRPLIFQQWLPAALLGIVVVLLVVAGVVDVAAIRIVAALLAGVVLAVGAAVLAGTWYIRRQRKRIRQWIEGKLPPISPESH
jgi:hypothetical protein